MGSEGDITPYLLSRYFGVKRLSTLYALTWTAYAVGGATGPVVQRSPEYLAWRHAAWRALRESHATVVIP
jgi:hypothetical protein